MTNTSVPAPPRSGRSERVRGVDMARGVALLGMVAVHTLSDTDDAGNPTLSATIAGGTSAALFGFLAGVAVAFVTGRRRLSATSGSVAHDTVRLLLRAGAVGVLGLALGAVTDTDTAEIILCYYAVLFVLAVPLVFLGRRTLLVLGALLVVAAPVASVLVRSHLATPDIGNPSFGDLVTDPVGLITTLGVTGSYPALSWLPYLCVGLAVGRSRLGHTTNAVLLTGVGVALVVAASSVSAVLLGPAGGLAHILADPGLDPSSLQEALTTGPDGTTPTSTWWWLAVDTAHSSTPLDLARTLGTSLTVLGAALLVDRAIRWNRERPSTAAELPWWSAPASGLTRAAAVLREPLAAAGSMTLTFYSLHVVFLTLADDLDPGVSYIGQVVVILLAGLAWRRWIGRGPLEAAVHALTTVAPRPTTSTGVTVVPPGQR